MEEALVSIITPVYNCQNYIEDTIKSVINQTYKNWELLIIDDFSTDNTLEIVKRYKMIDKRIKILKLKSKGGASQARNLGMKFSTGKYVAFLDGDDLWDSEKLVKQINYMENTGYAFTYTNYISFNNQMKKEVESPPYINFQTMIKINQIGCLTVVLNIEKIGKIYIPKLDKRNDYALWLKILKDKIKEGNLLNETLAFYRSHNGVSNGNKIHLLKYHYELFNKVLEYNRIISFFYTLRNGFYYCFGNFRNGD